MTLRLILLVMFSMFLNNQVANAQMDDPATLVETVTGKIFADITENMEMYKAEPDAVKAMVRRDLIPLLDVKYAARLILGRAGRGIEPAKIDEFARLMSDLLVERYADGLLQFSSEVKLKVLPQRGELNEKVTKVRTRVTLPSGGEAPVDYAFRKTPEGWKAFDVIVEGISYITTYRNQIMPDVEANGIDSLIERLSKGELEITE